MLHIYAGGSKYKLIDEEAIRQATEETDVSLLNNAVIGASAPVASQPDVCETISSEPADCGSMDSSSQATEIAVGVPNEGAGDDKAVAARGSLTVTEFRERMAASSITRTWEGLDPNVGNTPVEKAVEGRRGTPSSGYAHPTSQDRT